jgi:ribosomal protein L36
VNRASRIVEYLRKENKKVRDQTEKIKEDLLDIQDQNKSLSDVNACAGASFDSMAKQTKILSAQNIKLEENLKKYNKQNKQLECNLADRNAYFKAEVQIQNDYEKAMEQIVELLEDKWCRDCDLVQRVNSTYVLCERIASSKAGNVY